MKHSCAVIRSIIIGSALSFVQLIYADGPLTYYAFYPTSTLALGHGFDPEHLNEPKISCMDFESDDLDAGAALATTSSVSMVYSVDELRTTLGVDDEADAHYLVFQGSHSFDINFDRAVTSDAATFVFLFHTEYGRQGIKNWKLNSFGESVKNDPVQLRQNCGSQLVMIVRRASTVAVIVTVHHVDTTVATKLSGELKGGVDLGILGGNAKLDLSGALNTGELQGEIEIQTISTGGNGFADLKDTLAVITHGGNVDALNLISESLKNFIAGFGSANAAPVGYWVGAFPYYDKPYGDLWGDEKRRRLLILVDAYRKYSASAADIANVLNGDPRKDFLSPSQISGLTALVPRLTAYLGVLETAHARCLATTSGDLGVCTMPGSAPDLPTYIPPTNRIPVSFGLVVDGELWLRAKAEEVLADPGGGSLLSRVKIRKPTASTASLVLVYQTTFLSDVTIIDTLNQAELRYTLYPGTGKTVGDTLPGDRSGMRVVVLRGAAEDGVSDVLIDRDIFNIVRTLCPITSPQDTVIHGPALPFFPPNYDTGRIIARARNPFVQFDFNVTTFEAYNPIPLFVFLSGPGAKVLPAWGEAQFGYSMPWDICYDAPPPTTSADSGLNVFHLSRNMPTVCTANKSRGGQSQN